MPYINIIVNSISKVNDSVNKDLLRLGEFCHQKASLNLILNFDFDFGDEYNQSLSNFFIGGVKTLLSDQSNAEKKSQLTTLARKNFSHRHWGRRLLVDALLLISCFFGVGLAIGIYRKVKGKSFFAYTDDTARTKDLINHRFMNEESNELNRVFKS
ncbi:MAG: hypothetical protein LEGION0398_MBIBDBAK_00776 [Legionellaceae bacterium]